MADTVRTLAALQALLADNTTQNISPQDVRDMLVSILGVYGGLKTTAGSTPLAPGPTPVILAPWSGTLVNDDITVNGTTGVITLTTAGDYMVLWNVSLTFTTLTDATVRVELFQEGSGTGNIMDQNMVINTLWGIGGSTIITAAAADEIDLRVSVPAAGTNTDVAAIVHGQFLVRRVA